MPRCLRRGNLFFHSKIQKSQSKIVIRPSQQYALPNLRLSPGLRRAPCRGWRCLPHVPSQGCPTPGGATMANFYLQKAAGRHMSPACNVKLQDSAASVSRMSAPVLFFRHNMYRCSHVHHNTGKRDAYSTAPRYLQTRA